MIAKGDLVVKAGMGAWKKESVKKNDRQHAVGHFD